jgi:hypothetical protein
VHHFGVINSDFAAEEFLHGYVEVMHEARIVDDTGVVNVTKTDLDQLLKRHGLSSSFMLVPDMVDKYQSVALSSLLSGSRASQLDVLPVCAKPLRRRQAFLPVAGAERNADLIIIFFISRKRRSAGGELHFSLSFHRKIVKSTF